MKKFYSLLLFIACLSFSIVGQTGSDACSGAVSIACGDTWNGNTNGFGSDSAPTCGGVADSNAEGVWYRFTGTGDDVTISLCGSTYDTRLRVFTGTCAALICEAGNDDFAGCSPLSEVNFTSVNGTTYYVLVYGRQGGANSGDYTISVTCITPITNDLCTGAIAVTCGSTTSGNTVGTNGANPDTEIACGTAADGTGGGVWYSFEGTGDDITASLCSNAAYDTQIRVFSGACGGLTCVAGNDDFCGVQSEVSFTSAIGTTYYILVHGSGANEGAFDLVITCIPPLIPGNDCASAIAISCPGGTYSGSIVGASTSTEPTCGATSATTSGAIWYQISGNDQIVTANLCNSTAFNTQLLVYTGSCGVLSCVTDNDDFCGARSEVTFAAAIGTEYFIVVTGFSGAELAYQLDVSCAAPIAGDACTTALPIACGASVSGDITSASTSTDPVCGGAWNSASGAIWYEFTGTGDITTASLCGGASFDTQLLVYEGTCGTLTCVDGNDGFCGNQSQVTFPSSIGATYYIVVTGDFGQVGPYTMTLTCSVPPPGDECSAALPIACGATVNGDLIAASTSTEPICGGTFNSTSGAIWYEYTGSGDFVTASLCGGASFDTQLLVYSGTCGTLTCITGNDGFCGNQSEVGFFSTVGTTYYIVVTGDFGQVGTYTMTLTCLVPPAGDECSLALPIACGASVTGNLTAASTSIEPACSGAFATSSGAIWYEYIGDDQVVTASLCNAATTFDTQLVVYSGFCSGGGNLTCVIANDGFCGNQSQVSFLASTGTTYYIVVTGDFGQVGTYELDLTCSTPLVNDPCSGAIDVVCGVPVNGTTVGSTPDSPITCGSVFGSTSGGVWYHWTGNGDFVNASLCGSSYDTQILVYSGACGSLTCENGNSDFCGNQSQVTFQSINGTEYYFLVYGEGSFEGAFTFELECLIPTGGDDCASATMVTCGSSYVGTTVGAGTDSAPVCGGEGDGTGGGIWYEFAGTGDYVTASLCGSDYDTKIRIYEGTCGALTCVSGNDDFAGCSLATNSQVTFQSFVGTTYYILVHGDFASEGLYNLSIACDPDPFTTGDCGGRTPLCTNLLFLVNPNGPGFVDEICTGCISNPSSNPASGNSGCLLSGELNSTWFTVTIFTSGTLEFSFGATSPATTNCYDWIMWPMDDASVCANIAGSTLPPVRCNWNAPCAGFTGIASVPPAGGNAGNFEPTLNVLAGEQYVICFSNFSSAFTNVPIEFFGTAGITCEDGPLPVEILSFEGKGMNGYNELIWETGSEINNSHFEIERSINAIDFEKIGMIEGGGNSTEILDYSFNDFSPNTIKTNYYRLKQVDFDWEFSYSHVVAITPEELNEFSVVSSFPNPANNEFNIQLLMPQDDLLDIEIRDVYGKVVQSITKDYGEGNNLIQIPISDFAFGIYMISITNQRTEKSEVIKLAKY